MWSYHRIKTLYLPFFTKFLCDLGKLKQIWSKSAPLAVQKKNSLTEIFVARLLVVISSDKRLLAVRRHALYG